MSDDLCDRCRRSGVEISHTDRDGNTVCVECASTKRLREYTLSDDDIQFIAEQIMTLYAQQSGFNAETVAQDLMASLTVCSVRNTT